MADLWLPQATRKSWPNPNIPGSTYWDGNADVRPDPLLVEHTTEGHQSCPGYQNTQGQAGGFAPQTTIVPQTREFFQHIPLNRAGRALPYYNSCGVQVEIAGSCSIAWAKEAGLVYVGDFTDADLAFIDECLGYIIDAMGIRRVAQVAFASYEDLASGKTSVRLTPDQLAATSGFVGHQHIPSGGHIDPGILGTALTGGLTQVASPTPAPTVQDASPLTKDDILAWQKAYNMPVCDGVLSAPTSAFVERLQRSIGKGSLVVDGILGPATKAAIIGYFKVASWDQVPAALRASLAPKPAPAPTPKPAPAPAPAPKPAEPTVQQGSTGAAVKTLQAAINAWSAAHKWKLHLEVDGIFGPLTDYAVRALQHGAGITVDGIVGPHTWAALDTYR